ncbi:MAG TPA: DUF3999 family protein [Caldimonas sp.]|nr:DUF3999 family protein [Caldimonas sp.]HEX4232986.1 DUF3999 family protein [Caldimonas sp.]
MLGFTAAAGSAADPAPYRYRAPIVVDAPAPFVRLALPPAAYGYVEQDDLRDLRIVDARGERVPFAVLPALSSVHTSEQVREATLYPLPARPTAAGVWPSPVDVVVEGDRISVHRRGVDKTVAPAPRESGGWLIDSGETRAGDPLPRSLRLHWSAPAEFSATYRIESSDDLRQWRSGGSGQVMALQSAAGALTQPVVGLGDASGRFVRLVWADPATAPALTGATVLVAERHQVAVESARELVFAPLAESRPGAAFDQAARRALVFDLGGALPVLDVDLRFAAGTHVAPVRLQGRTRADQPWRELGGGVFYRLERDHDVGTSPAIALPTTVRYLRVVADERAAALDPRSVQLVVHAALASLVIAMQGEPPLHLLAGSADAPAGALPIALVVPQLDSERARFGRARLGEFEVDAVAAQAAESAARSARLRPWLLWAVLLAGVAGLGALVWRLARTGPQPPR